MNQKRSIPKAFLEQLAQLRRQLVGWTALQGLSRWICVVLAVLACDMLLDRLFGMDYIQRAIVLVAMIAGLAGTFCWRVVRPLFLLPSDQALVYEIEAKHPQLGESLLTATQLGKSKPETDSVGSTGGVSSTLVDAAIEQGFDAAEGVDFSQVLNAGKRRTHLLTLAVGAAILLGLGIGVTQSSFLKTWFNRNILLGDAQWPRQTYLEITGVENGRLQLPRGADHRQTVDVTEDSRRRDVLVSLEIENGSNRMIQPMKSTGRKDGREHLFVFHNLSAPFRFRASGGDDVTPWVQVELVEPPAIIDLQLTASFPAYTAAAPMLLEGSGPHALLAGSRLQVAIGTNKSLSAATLKHDGNELTLASIDDSQQQFGIDLPTANESTDGTLRGGEYQFALRDVTGLANVRTSKFALTIKDDKPPQVRASLLGISGLVVPNAMLPTSFEAVDEYGLRDLNFQCQWKTTDMDDSDEPIQRAIDFVTVQVPSSTPPPKRMDDVEVLDLTPLKLQPGASFRFQVEATDHQPSGNGIGQSAEMLLRIVSAEELRADLLRREIEQRKAFLRARDEQLELTGQLEQWATRADDGANAAEFTKTQESDLIRMLRQQKGLGTTVDRVATRFEEFLVEVQNNRLNESEAAAGIAPENRLTTRFDRGIIQPIRELDRDQIAQATRLLDGCRLALSSGEDLFQAVQPASEMQREILVRMDEILRAMTSSEDYQEVVNKALELKADQQRLKNDILKSLEPTDIFSDEDLEDVFDD